MKKFRILETEQGMAGKVGIHPLSKGQLTGVLVKRKSWKVRMDPGRDPTAGFFQG